ncbi:hypothetical protein BB560_000452 [Smittium megazygosporum]|uniref:Glycosyltransferase family 15 protein n=1 Tax=Smittium megazygosporum TaxID=133381 RepID=A0A2T9ZKF7_9FUNG|nr:hypothetical protein BB560_000452 [Smittium megazygosporum]
MKQRLLSAGKTLAVGAKSTFNKRNFEKLQKNSKASFSFSIKILNHLLTRLCAFISWLFSPSNLKKHSLIWFVFLLSFLFFKKLNNYKLAHERTDDLSAYYYGITYDPVADVRGGDTSSTSERENAALVALVRNSELKDMQASMIQLENRWNHKYNYPYVFFNDEPFSDEFRRGVQSITKSNITFVTLTHEYWSLPEDIDLVRFMVNLQKNRRRYIYGGKLSYRLMCRFESMLFYKHPALASYKYYWRIEPDVDYYCNINYDPFRYMRTNGLVYGFTIAFSEIKSTIETLWETTKQWIEQNPQYIPEENAADWILDDDGNYNLCHFWSNFEIVDMDFYRSQAYESYVKHLDDAGGYFYERWGDAPIHSIAASILLPKSKIFWFEDIGYRHSNTYVCPSNFEMSYNCFCKKAHSYHRSSCHRKWSDAKGLSRSQFFEKISIPENN